VTRLHFLSLPRYWAVAVPAYLCVAMGVFLCLYLGANLLLVPALEDPRTITGEDRFKFKRAETHFPLKARLLVLVPKLLVNLQSIARQLDVSYLLPCFRSPCIIPILPFSTPLCCLQILKHSLLPPRLTRHRSHLFTTSQSVWSTVPCLVGGMLRTDDVTMSNHH